MFLKTLTLKGFKSFADTTSLELEPGITVVVGPNGSGKSNVVDAIAWVLGAQGPRTVRSSKMDDVIFAGTTSRPALGRAEVALTIDNGSGMLPIELAEVTISRTLFRSGDSEYAINGVPCRLLDVQELLSDSGVGRQQHVIVGQGQIDAVLNARPEDRRAVIEEAAGVLKFRRRKEKAERRLESTEANLLRLSDLLREVRRQLRPLERQAEAARRHGDLVTELVGIRLHLAGRELAGLRTRLTTSGSERDRLGAEEAELKAELADLDGAVLATEAELSAMGADDLGEALVRLERLGERARGLTAVLTERRRGLERERATAVDAAVVASLEAEADRLRRDLGAADDDAARLVPEADRLAEAEAGLAAERQAFEARWSDGVPAASGAAAEVRGELAALQSGVERGQLESSRLQDRLASLTAKAERLAGEAAALRERRAAAQAAVEPLAAEATTAENRHHEAEVAAAGAEVVLRDSEADRRAWEARADALALALDEVRARAGAERLAGVAGVLGTLAELVDVDPGWEAAFEAAAGAALSAVVVDGHRSAIEALAALQGSSGSLVAPAGPERPAPPAVGEPLLGHVHARRPEAGPALDALLGAAVCVDGGWERAVDAALAHPTAVVVTRDGDRFAPGAWQVGVAGVGATGAALDEARDRAASAVHAVAEATEALAAARRERDEARVADADAARRADTNRAQLDTLTATIARIDAEAADADAEAEAIRGHLGELAERVAQEQSRATRLQDQLPGLEAEEKAVADQGRVMHDERRRLDERAAAVTALRTDLEVRARGIDERRSLLQARLAEVEERLVRNTSERDAAASRREDLDRRLLITDGLARMVGARLAWADAASAALRERRRRQSEAARATAERLDGIRRKRTAAERRLEELRELARRAELDLQEVQLRLESAVESVRNELDTDPDTAIAAECPPLPEGATPAARLRELERELRIMGPINPLALEEFEALQERHTFLQEQLDDVKASRRELARVIRAVDEEIVNVFAAAYADVSENFTALFETLFPGGQGRLRLTDPDDVLNTGIEIEARPSGKNVRKLSLLSGGERSLTALAFLFAVFRSRPSPFYVMDEVEAALDDINLHRFLDLVEEFRREAQLLIVSHQKRTMEVADTLYGVSMQPGGSSRVVSERVAAGAPA